jgi:hypothetical protein
MKILLFTAIQGRQHITELFLMGVKRLQMFSGHEVSLLCVASEQEDIDFLTERGIEYCVAPNKPLSSKFEFGFKEAIKKDFDYMLRMGSDDLLDHNIFESHYNRLMSEGKPFFGLKTIAEIEHDTLDTVISNYMPARAGRLLGAGSMLSRSLCLNFNDKPLYSKKPLNRGLDNASETELKKYASPIVVDTGKPSLIDVKSKKNIWPFRSLIKNAKKADFEKTVSFLSEQEYHQLKYKGQNFRVVAVIPVKGRLPLLKWTIKRLIEKNKVFKVICVGDGEEREPVEKMGAVWVHHENKPLGKKWNAGFMKAKEFEPHACLFVGSSDWISDNWIEHCEPYMGTYDMIGKPDFNLLDYGKQLRLCHWAGYTDPRRKGEPIGIGRMLSARILELMHWQPMDPKLDSSLDYSMWKKVENHGGTVGVLRTDKIQSLSLSTDAWENKHKFNDHFQNKKGLESTKMEPDGFLKEWFPEAFDL